MPENLHVLGGLLSPQYRVRVANSGIRALQVAASPPRPDLILLDIMMPDLDGHGVLARLRADPQTRDIPVIFVTALDGQREEEQGLREGAVDYITKPIQPAIVLARVQAQLELKHARDILRDHNAFLETEVARRMRDNLIIQEAAIRALASLAEARDLETGNHISRTQAYVRALAQHLAGVAPWAGQLTPARIDIVAKAAPLHDIGKVGIPDAILLKPGRLTADEFEIMKGHAAIGGEAIDKVMSGILSGPEAAELAARYGLGGGELRAALVRDDRSPLAFFGAARDIARHHHECWDGSGYPDGLAGEAIPLAARLMTVADVYDALISRRVYKEPMSDAEAAAIIQAGRGSRFDPTVVDAFLALGDKFREIARCFADEDGAREQASP
jgi:putative two-component system response regulator